MAKVVQFGSFNTNAVSAPGVVVQILPPSQTLINGVPTNVVGLVGTAIWGPVNSATQVSTPQDYAQKFGPLQINKYDMGTAQYVSSLQGQASFLCVRVTDGTDTAASKPILDGGSVTGMTLTALYTGSYGNQINAIVASGSQANSKKITIAAPNVVPEVFDNITGSGSELWENIVNAINLGQNGVRGPSQFCIASLNNFISGVNVVTAGSYATLPTLGTTGNGSGATFAATMKATSATVANAGTGYAPADTITPTGGSHTINSIITVATTQLVSLAVNAGGSNYVVGDTITLAGGTFGTAAIVTVSTVSSGAITGVTITNAGSYTANAATFTQGSTSGVGSGATFNTTVWGVNTVTIATAGAYTALPSNPVSQGSTSGSGTGATFTTLWGLLSVAVTAGGLGYDSTSAFSVTGGGGTGGAIGTLNIGSAAMPISGSYTLVGGTDGISNVIASTLVGDDSATPRKGMYALRSTDASMVALVDCDDSTTYTDQVSFGLSEGMYMLGVGPAGQSIASAITAKNNAGIDSYAMKLMIGDWIYFADPVNNITRLVSPQGYIAGVLSNLSPEQSSLNKRIFGLVGTQKSVANQRYADTDIVTLVQNGLDVIANPSPGGNYFAAQTGQNTSSNAVINDDHYTRLTNYLAFSIGNALGSYIGLLQTPSIRLEAKNTIQSFLQNLADQNMIGDVNGGPPYKVVLDASNNPSNRVALGYMQADVQVVDFFTIRVFLVNLQNGQVTLQSTQSNNQ